MDLFEFIGKLQRQLDTGQAGELSYRSDLQQLFEGLGEDLTVVNEAKRQEAGAPDLIVLRGVVPIGHVEAKDINLDILALKGYCVDQLKRYRDAFPNLVYTNGIDWQFYVKGEKQGPLISIARLDGQQLTPLEPNFVMLRKRLEDFIAEPVQSIRSASALAKMMAGKAIMIRETMTRTLERDLKNEADTQLVQQFHAFKDQLLHDLDPEKFGDLYAETIAYGLFAARLHDPTLEDFSRAEALELLPKSNPFLRRLFQFVAGYDLDEGIVWIIDELVQVFLAANVRDIMRDFGRFTGRHDPFLHFYETFLAEYDPAKREAAGVYYTPEAVVQFIVRAVDEVLRDEFGIADGLADTSKIDIKIDNGQGGVTDKRVHRVQVLDPATGTGTFLAEVIKLIAPRIKDVAEGAWPQYVEEELIPRLHGFELLMAAYSMCHLKLEMVLRELGYKPTAKEPRLNVFLTNSLEEAPKADQTLFGAQWLSDEANAANEVKRDTPVMCVIGNPPYSGHSQNKGEWIESLMADYKVSPELKRPAQAKWLSDDYVKFIRFSEHLINKNGEGILGFITNHGYLDNPTFMDMRKHLLETFDKIYIIDLHGNSKKKEISPDRSPDKNVFDIQQGVAIIIGVKKKSLSFLSDDAKAPKPKNGKQLRAKKPSFIQADAGVIAKVFHLDLWGSRKEKSYVLSSASLLGSKWSPVDPHGPRFDFSVLDLKKLKKYTNGFSCDSLMSLNGRPSPGLATMHDWFAVSENLEEFEEKFFLFQAFESEEEARRNHKFCNPSQWRFSSCKAFLLEESWRESVESLAYRPMDKKLTVLNRNVAVHQRLRLTNHLRDENLAICLAKNSDSIGGFSANPLLMIDGPCDLNLFRRGGAFAFPLYLYPDEDSLETERKVNFDPDIHAKILETATPKGGEAPDEVAIFDYIYGALHDPGYRETYADFLKSDFPRVPYPKDSETFARVSAVGTQLRELHLMEQAAIDRHGLPTSGFKGEGDSVVEKLTFKQTDDSGKGQVFINKTQYFDTVPQVAWAFYIGGYQPAQKWLKDRKGRKLEFADLKHYQNIIKILAATPKLMAQIDLPL